MATSTAEDTSPVLATAASQQPDLETSVEPGSAIKPEPSEARHDRDGNDEEEARGSSVPGQENAGGQRVAPEWVEERFRIDRKKLESMLFGECCT